MSAAGDDAADDDAADDDAADGASVCLNCGARLGGPFCTQCGQRDRGSALRLGQLVRDAFAELTDLDRGFARTFRGMTVAPGGTILEYVNGRRAVHAGPIRYYVIMAAVWMAFPTLIGFDLHAHLSGTLRDPGTAVTLQPLSNTFGISVDNLVDMLAWMNEWRRWTALGRPVLLAFAAWLAFRSARRTFAEWLAFALFASAHMLILEVVGILLMSAGLDLVSSFVQLAMYPYIAWACYGFTGPARWLSAIKGIIALFAAGMVVSAVVLVLAVVRVVL